MSDTLLNLIARPEEYDPFTPQQKLATLAQTQAGTQGLNIQNQQGQLQLGLRQMQLASLAGQIPGAQGGGLAALANNGGGGQSGAIGQLTGAAGATGGPQNSLSGTVSPQSGGTALPPSQGVTMAGFSMPANWAMSALSSNDPAKVYSDAWTTRMARLHQLATSAGSPQQWDQNVTQAFQEGWLSPQEYQLHLGNYAAMARVQQSLASPDAQLSYNSTTAGQGLQSDANGNPMPSAAAITAKGAIAGAEKTAQNQSDLQFRPQIDQAENGPLIDRAVQTVAGTLPYEIKKAQAGPYTLDPSQTRINPPIPGATNPDGTNQPARGVDMLNANPIPASAYAARVNASENGTGNSSARNPRSTATGDGQFTDGTWLSTIRQARPDLAGQSDQQLLALRSNPQLSSAMTAAYGQQNAGVLQQAGMPVTSATLGMAHRLGPADAITVMGADPTKPLAAVLSADVIARNPDLARQTVGSFINGSVSKYGNQPVSFGQAQGFGSGQPTSLGTAPPPPRLPLARADEQFPPAGTAATPAAASTAPVPITPAPFNPAQIPPLGPPGGVNAGASAQPNGTAPGGPSPQGFRPGGPGTEPAPGTVSSPAAVVAATNPPPPAAGALSGPIITPLPGGGTAVQSGISPIAIAQQKTQNDADIGAMTSYRNGLLTDAQKAAQSNGLIDTMRTEAQQFAQGGGVNADWRDLQATMNNWSNLLNGSPFPAVSNVEAFNKAAGQLVREAASTVSPRVGVQELQMVQKSLLSDDTSPQGFQKIADQLQGIADYRIAKSAAASQATGNPNAFEANWDAHVSPLAFIVNRMPIADAQQLAVQLNKTEQGRKTLNGIMAQMQYADQNGLFKAVP